nr:MAG TPA: hypothetical protein [Caudoviricetes sp.]
MSCLSSVWHTQKLLPHTRHGLSTFPSFLGAS